MTETTKQILFISKEEKLIAETKKYFAKSNKYSNLKFSEMEITKTISSDLSVFDLIIIDVKSLLQDINGTNFAQILLDKKLNPLLLVLSSEEQIYLPSALNVYEIVSYPPLPAKICEIIEEMLENHFL